MMMAPAPGLQAAPAPPGHAAPLAGAPTQAALCRTAIAAAEAQTRIPDEFLSAIGRVESGRPVPGIGLTPWPWTINAAGTGHFYATRAAAVAAARDFLAAGVKSIDVGCLQVNLMYHPEAFASLNEAFDPDTNAAFAARLLLSLFQQQRSWPRAAAAYHSETPALGQAYQQKVLAAWAEPDGAEAGLSDTQAFGAAPAMAGAPARFGAPAGASVSGMLGAMAMPKRPFLPNLPVRSGLPSMATSQSSPGMRDAAMPAVAQAAPGGIAAAPVAGFTRSLRLPGAAAPMPTGRLLAAYRAFPVHLAVTAPPMAPHTP